MTGVPRELTSVVGVPLVPSVVADAAALDVPVKAGLENGGIASVAINANPLYRQSRVSSRLLSAKARNCMRTERK